MKRLCFLWAIPFAAVLGANAQSLAKSQLDRLDVRFQSLLAAERPELGLRPVSSLPPRLEVEVVAGKTDVPVYGAAIYADDPAALREAGIPINSTFASFATARLTVDHLVTLAGLDGVRFVDAGETLYPQNDVARAVTGAALLQAGEVNNTVYDGTDVIVCVIDTGIEIDHADFYDDGSPNTTRILHLWDQTLTKLITEDTPDDAHAGSAYDGFDYGVEYTAAHINDEIDGVPALFVRQQDTDGHGTHVAGTAAGDGSAVSGSQFKGMAPDADLVIVKAGNGSFSFSNVIDGLSYCGAIASDAGKPVVVNMSLGTDQGPHDGTRSQDTAIDSFIGAGKAVVVSAGNTGGDNIHTTDTIADSGSDTITLTVASPTGTSDDDAAIDIWFTDQTGAISVTVTSPNSQVANTSGVTNTSDGQVEILNELDGTNGDRHVQIEIDDGNGTEVAAGSWTIQLSNSSGGSLTYHAWLYDSSIGSSGSVTLTGGDDNYIVGSPGSATGAITVGSFVSRANWCDSGSSCYTSSESLSDALSSFSSLGPRPDAGATQKPDIVGPGQHVVSSWSSEMSSAPSSARQITAKHRLTQGTSMSAPAVAGGLALLLDETSTLTAAQLKTLIRDSADADSHTGSVPNDSWGYGKFNVHQAMVRHLAGTPGAHEVLAYDGWSSTESAGFGANVKFAVRFTPTISGEVSGLFLHPSTTVSITSALSLEIWSNDGSNLPDSKQGSTVSLASADVDPGTWNYVDMTGAGVSVTAGTSYHVVAYFTSGTSFFIASESGSVDGRSSKNTGSWAADTEDYRLRPVVTNSAAVTSLGTAATGNDAGWRMFAPPSTGMTRASIAGITFSSSNSGNDLVRRFDESAGSGDARWLNTGSSDSLPQGQGFIVYYFDDATDPVNPNLTLSWAGASETTADFETASLDTDEEFHLLGNPFYTTFDLSQLNLSGQGFQTTVQVWNPGAGSYTTVTQSGGSTDLIAMGQGFFAQRSSTSVGSTTVTYDADGRTKAGTLVGKRADAVEPVLGFWLTVTDPSGRLVAFDEAARLVFRDGAIDGWDALEASKLTPLVPAYATVAFVGSRAGRTELLSQASYPLTLTETLEIPLELDAVGVNGKGLLSWPTWEGIPDGWDLDLVDVETGFSTDLRRTSGYGFSVVGTAQKSTSAREVLGEPVKKGANGIQRFIVRISPASSTGNENEALPAVYTLGQNYPNPFNQTTRIRFGLPEAGPVKVAVYDLLGRTVATLWDGPLAAGWHERSFDAGRLASGVYLYRLTTPAGTETRAMQLLR